jgi:glycosyltransferase involved in cell wall biosynthesis
VIVAFLSYFSVLSASKVARAATRVVFNVQTPLTAFLDDPDYHWGRPWDRRVFAAAVQVGCRAADLVVTTSRGVADDLVQTFRVPQSRVRVVHNPVDLAAIRSAAAEPLDPVHAASWRRPVVVAAGRLAEAKNYPLLIAAMQTLRERTGLDARLFILGQGDCEMALRALITEKGLDGVVSLCGFQQNPWRYIARADVFALTSRYEGFGNVLVEAMACGVPVVATMSPGTRDIVTSGVDGMLVEQHDPASFAAALAEVLTDEPLRRRRSDAARINADRFAAPAIASAYDRVLMEMIA